jgi:hypothetical protein
MSTADNQDLKPFCIQCLGAKGWFVARYTGDFSEVWKHCPMCSAPISTEAAPR